MKSRLFIFLIFPFCQFLEAQNPWPELRPMENEPPLAGTEMLNWDEDISLRLVKLNDAFLDRQIEKAVKKRASNWVADDSVSKNRELLKRMLGLHRDERVKNNSDQILVRSGSENPRVKHVRWRAFSHVYGSGILIEPEGKIRSRVILIPDASGDAGLEKIIGPAEDLTSSGCRVLIPRLISRETHPKLRMSNREWLHRPAFELGRTLIGYELHKIFSAADWFASESDDELPLGVMGFGEGGLLALYAGALDERFKSVGVAGYFGPREKLWIEPAERNVFGLLNVFGDAELARLIHPRTLLVSAEGAPGYVFRPGENGEPERLITRAKLPGKPGKIPQPGFGDVKGEWDRIPVQFRKNASLCQSEKEFLSKLTVDAGSSSSAKNLTFGDLKPSANLRALQIAEIERHNQMALVNAAADRKEYWKDLDTSSLENFEKTIEPYRERFRRDVIGDFEEPRVKFNARSRPFQQSEKTVSYEVALDVMEGVIAYGILTLPKNLDLSSGEKRPVVVCQHGLEGTPQDVVGEPKFKAYKAFATRLAAEHGLITFAPQNGYKYFDLFRIQQFKAQSIGKTLFSTIIPQHMQITDWLASLPFVDADRIGFYGLSYGGKSAMRIPPLVDRYCLSICSADFNEWVWKNAATDSLALRYSYANKGEYEIFEWNLGGTFNYAEMSWLIAPRPFMVERGHFDGVGPDEQVGFEFGKVRHLYQAKLGLKDRCEIEWFVGPHTINGVGTFAFLRKHLISP